MSRRIAIALLAALVPLAAPSARAQERPAPDSSLRAGTLSPAPAALLAARAERAPVLDGRDDDAVWRAAPEADDFRQFSPAEGGQPSERTTVRAAYDERNLYVFVRAFDAHPDSIVSLLARRDVGTPSDQIKLLLDPYRDRRTGVELAVNPAGVKRDASIFDDVNEDLSWDAVWDVATRVDSLGWTAEFRVPLSQLRFEATSRLTFGFGVWRDVARKNERVSWPAYRPSRRALASQLGELGGLVGLEAPRRLEVLPYAVAKAYNEERVAGWRHRPGASGGADVRLGVTANLTLDATINPDFGQVEADPAELNLSAFETRFQERRPFFLEGLGLFRCNGPCEGVFYTRRIGRAPQLRRDARDPNGATILGAAKLTGRVGRGLSVGLIDAVTDREVGVDRGTVEPRTNYLVARAYQELRGGRSGAGAMLTATDRALDDLTAPLLRRSARTLLLQGFHRFARDRYEATAYAGLNRVEGSREAIAATQLSPVHLYQRPDARRYDSTRTSLGGAVKSVQLRKIDGAFTFGTNLRHADPGLELNDLGFVPNVDEASVRNDATWRTTRPGRGYRALRLSAETMNRWTVRGLPTAADVDLEGEVELPSTWDVQLRGSVDNWTSPLCVSCARGGPALRISPRYQTRLNVFGDRRRALRPTAEVALQRGDEGRSWLWRATGGADVRVASRLSGSATGSLERRADDAQWAGAVGDPLSDTAHYTFAHLARTTGRVQARASYTATPTLSLQLYVEPFVTVGHWADRRELADPRARRYEDRFTPYADAALDDFNVKAFNSNAVARWEYRPGSVLFVVWQQGREQSDRDPGSFQAWRDARNLLRAHPRNTVLVKASYWIDP